MSEQNEQAPVVDTPAPAEQQPNESAVDYQQRYQEAQAWGTRSSQEAAEYRRQLDQIKAGDPEALRALGLEIEDQEDTFAEDTGLDPYDQRIAALESRLQEQQDNASQQAQLQQIEQHVEQQLGQLEGLSESDRDMVVRLAVAMDPSENGMPDIKGAFDSLVSRDTEAQKRWATTKRAPRVSPNGQAGTQQPDLTNTEERQAFMAQRLAALDE